MSTEAVVSPDVFTPLAEDGRTRLSFPLDTVEVLTGDITSHHVSAVIRVDGRVYAVRSSPCGGGGCHCDAIATEITGTLN